MGKSKEIKSLLGKRIKELRVARGYSQQKLAELANIDQRNLSSIECGISFPSKCIFELAQALGTDISELFDFSHIKLNGKEMKEYISTKLNYLTDDSVKIIYKLIKTLD